MCAFLPLQRHLGSKLKNQINRKTQYSSAYLMEDVSIFIEFNYEDRVHWFVKAALKYHRRSDLTQTLIFSHFWRPEIQDQGVGRIGSF